MVPLAVNVVLLEASPSGLWRPPAKRVEGLKPSRGFKSRRLRQFLPQNVGAKIFFGVLRKSVSRVVGTYKVQIDKRAVDGSLAGWKEIMQHTN